MKPARYVLITVLDSISETSMPLNEFVIYRNNHDHSIKQIVFICDKKKDTTVKIPEEIECIYVDRDVKKINKKMKEILLKYHNNVVVHLHQIKSSFLFYRATISFRYRYKSVFTVHSSFQMRTKKYKLSSIICALLSNKITCVSKSSYMYYSKFVKSVKRNNISVIQNGVDIERIDSVAQNFNYIDKKDCFTIVNVGRIIPLKNQELLVRIFPKLKDCKIILVGKENDNNYVQNLINETNLQKKVIITGLISREEVFSLLKKADLFISCSKIEGMPISVLEAMYIGLPVILSNISPHKEIFRFQNNENLISLADDELWIKKINTYISKDKSKLVAIGEENKNIVLKYYTLKIMHEQYNKLYLNLIKK